MNLFTIISLTWQRRLSVVLALVCAITFSGCSLSQLKTEAAQVPQLVDSSLSEPKTFNLAISQEGGMFLV